MDQESKEECKFIIKDNKDALSVLEQRKKAVCLKLCLRIVLTTITKKRKNQRRL